MGISGTNSGMNPPFSIELRHAPVRAPVHARDRGRTKNGPFSAVFATRAENEPFSALFGAIFGTDHVDFHALGHTVQNWIRLENGYFDPHSSLETEMLGPGWPIPLGGVLRRTSPFRPSIQDLSLYTKVLLLSSLITWPLKSDL